MGAIQHQLLSDLLLWNDQQQISVSLSLSHTHPIVPIIELQPEFLANFNSRHSDKQKAPVA